VIHFLLHCKASIFDSSFYYEKSYFQVHTYMFQATKCFKLTEKYVVKVWAHLYIFQNLQKSTKMTECTHTILFFGNYFFLPFTIKKASSSITYSIPAFFAQNLMVLRMNLLAKRSDYKMVLWPWKPYLRFHPKNQFFTYKTKKSRVLLDA
jgi:hypothetical protein